MNDPNARSSDPLDTMAGKTVRIFFLYCGFVLSFLVVSKIVIDVVLAYSASGARFVDHWATVRANPSFPTWTGDDATQESAILDAAREWTLHGGADFRFLEGPPTDVARVDGFDGVNAVFYLPRDSGFGALATTYTFVDRGSGSILGFDVVFWDRDGAEVFDWSAEGAPSKTEFDVQDTAAHELGHALGLGHSDIRGATMDRYGTMGSTSARSLHPDDRAGIEFLYGAANPEGPVITAIAPAEAELRGGATLRVSGAGLAGASLTIGGVAADVLETDDGAIVATVPAGEALGPAVVSVRGASGAETAAAGALEYVANAVDLRVDGTPAVGATVRLVASGPAGGALAILVDRKAGDAEFHGVPTGLALTTTSRTVADSLFETVAARPRLSASGEAGAALELPDKPGIALRTFFLQALVAPEPGAGADAVEKSAVVTLTLLP